MLVLIKGAGDLASGVALRLWRAGLRVAMTDLPRPTAIRRMVSFCRAIPEGEAAVEDARARFAPDADAARAITRGGDIAVLADPAAACRAALRPDALVDAILAKRNTGTSIADAPLVVALGPGFTAGVDCHAVVETQRGHDLGRVLWVGSAQPDTGAPGDIGGYTVERLLRAPRAGVFRARAEIGALVSAGETVATVDGEPIVSRIGGVVRGLLPDGTPVSAGFKCGDVDPRGVRESCYTVSDKARAVGGGVLEAILMGTGVLR